MRSMYAITYLVLKATSFHNLCGSENLAECWVCFMELYNCDYPKLGLYVSRCWMLEGGLYKGVKLTHCWQMSKMLFPPFFGPIWFCERKKDTNEYTIH